MRIGVGLWTMRATAAHPAAQPAMYRDLLADARLVESLGFHSLWLAEHHFWYDGWCPSPLVAASAALAVTSTLHVGTGIHLLPLCDPRRVGEQLSWLQRASGGRLQHGVGLGYRAAEYDGYGISRLVRGRRMDAALDWLSGLGDAVPPVWVGGFSPAALERAGRLGLGVLLPSTLTLPQLERAIAQARDAAAAAGRTVRIGVMKYAWATDGSESARAWALGMLSTFMREYAGAWFPLRGRPGFESPELLEAQVRRAADTALVGSPDELVLQLRALADAGAEQCVLHLVGDGRLPERHETLALIADRVVPALDPVPS
jgi:alkanesulfonate monooxygenase SsuD/methylene tetrahydromethanopterin reductase-like flavin-dependent oxidoreductase (luciferase family)